MFVGFYIVILCLSALSTCAGMVLATHQLRRMAGQPVAGLSTGWATAVASIGFLTVASAPPAVLVGASLVLLASFVNRAQVQAAALVVAIGLGLLALPEASHVPKAAWLGGAALAWAGISLIAKRLPDAAQAYGFLVILSLGAFALLCLVLGLPSSLPLDSAILMAALWGLMWGARAADRVGQARAPMAYLLGWLIVTAAAHLL